MDYSAINSWEDFSDIYTEILIDFLKNFDDVENRIKCVDCLLSNHPAGNVISGKFDKIDELNLWAKYYKIIMYLYICNSDLSEQQMRIELMWEDILNTEHIRTIDDKQKEKYYMHHTYLSSEVELWIQENISKS